MADLPSDSLEVQIAKQPVTLSAWASKGGEVEGMRIDSAGTRGHRRMGRGQAGELWLGKREGSRGMAEICFQMVV
jgi:hypothetical protein